ncbi:Protein of unknown function (DUF2973) [Rivularia sp. PCC 7116]|uniref:DUF2973 domain-containing protein n=1 Tax=Rivularia sp. PCC 7116 TaxID=373994 RepID=UPI00029EE3F8|nr:DUF2973 domain-containing protein [Rivularia sp. PCC 7116]AFY55106.1 Protein of unknown function (DUF2973) [Rivularia sp. PCC 7116]
MLLQLLYIVAFTILAFIAVANLIRNLIMFSFDRQGNYPARFGRLDRVSVRGNQGNYSLSSRRNFVPHPELLDNSGNIVKEPLLVMRSINVEDARQQLDALYESSPGSKGESEEI